MVEEMQGSREEFPAWVARLQAQADAVPTVVQAAIREHLRGLIREEGNLITEEVLREADRLYDMKGTVRAIAEALGLSVYELRKALARRREIRCADCGETFTVAELRSKGGYTPSREALCRRCRKGREEEIREDLAWKSACWEAEEQKRLRAEEQIRREVQAGRDPTAVEEFRRRLIRYALYWIAGSPPMLTDAGEVVPTAGGCMICGRPPAFLLVARPDRRQDAADVLPALWRTPPSEYFSTVVPFPLLSMPVVILCGRCVETAAETHLAISLGPVRVGQEGESRITAEACGVRLVLQRSRSRTCPWEEAP